MGESLDDVKFLLRSVLMSEKDGVEARKIEGLYRELAGGPVPYRTFGFSDRDSFLKSMPDVVSIQRSAMCGIVYVGVATPETAHIQRLKSRERSNRKSSKGKPMKGVLRKLTPRRAAWSSGGMYPASGHYPGPSSRSFHPSSRVNYRPPRPHNRPGFPLLPDPPRRPPDPPRRPQDPPRRRPSPERWESQSAPRTQAKIHVSTESVEKSLRMANQFNERNSPKKIVRENAMGKITIEVKRTPPKPEERKPLSELDSIKFGDNFEVPPRFRRKAKPDEIKVGLAAAIPDRRRAKSPSSPNLSANRQNLAANRQKSPGTSQFKVFLNDYSLKKELGKLTYDTITASIASRCGYVSSVRIEGTVYGSLDIFRSKREAEDAAAKNALTALDLLLDLENLGEAGRWEKSPVTTSQNVKPIDECLLKERISQILAKHPNGLWNTRLPHEYEDTYSEKPPSSLKYCLEKEWTDLVRMESVQGTESKIIYLQPAMSRARQAEDEPEISWKIAPAEFPKPGTKAQVYTCHIVDWLHFYVQRADSPIDKIKQDLARTCVESVRKVSSPEPGMFCIAKYPIDNQWYRARIVSVRKTETQVELDVCYVDFGNYESVDTDNICQLSAKLCQQPAQGIKLTLHDVHPIMDRNFDQVVESAFKELIGADEGQALLIDVVTVDADKGCSVKLYMASDLTQSINSIMIDKGFAIDYPPGYEPGYLELQESKEWNVYVSYINTTTNIIVRLVGPDYSDKLEELEDNLSSLEKRPCLRSGVQVGEACALRVQSDDGGISWYRVKIERFEGDKAWVSYLDHGDKECVSLESLRHLNAEFLQLPYQALSCGLTGLEAFVKDEKVLAKLCDLALGKTCVAEVDCRVNNVSLTLFDTSGEEDLNINETVAQVLSVEELRPKLPKIGSTVDGYVSYITEDGRIFFQELGPGLQRLDEVMTEISDMYDKQTGASLFLGQPEEDLCCVAKCAFDNKWYRAQIVQVLPGRMVLVSFVDYGNCEELPYSCLRCFPETHKYFQTLPFQVVECQLRFGGRWTPEAVNRFLELAPPEKLRMLEVLDPDSDDTDLPLVDILFFTEENELVSICDEILEPEKLFLGSDGEPEAAGLQECSYMETLVQDELDEAFCDAPLSLELEADSVGNERKDSSGQHVCQDHKTVQQNNVLTPDTVGSSVARTEYLHQPSDDNSDIRDTSLSSNDKSISDEVSFLRQYLPKQLKAPYGGASPAASSDLGAGSDPVLTTGSSVSNVTPEPVTPELKRLSREMKDCDINENSGIPRPGVIPSPKPNLDLDCDLYQQAVLQSGDDIYVTYVCDPTNFKCISESTRLELSQMMDALQTYYHRNDGLVPSANSLENGKVYAGYHADNWWYRVVIKTILAEAQQVSVKFVDYGDFSILSYQDLRLLDDQFLELPFQAVDAKLAGVRKLEHRWSDQAVERFRELAADKVLTAWIHGKDQNNAVSMTLIHAEGSQNAFIHKVMIEEGLAASC